MKEGREGPFGQCGPFAVERWEGVFEELEVRENELVQAVVEESRAPRPTGIHVVGVVGDMVETGIQFNLKVSFIRQLEVGESISKRVGYTPKETRQIASHNLHRKEL